LKRKDNPMDKKEAIDYCINLAKHANENDIRPNPFVGAIIVDEADQVIGEGFHQKLGGPHAEVYAIEQALQKTADLSQCCLYVSLEPCSHFGKTPPCVDLIIQHKIKKVVIASLDPNPKVSSVEKLMAAGIEVEVTNEPSAISLNRRFFTQQIKNRPCFILKTASTLDGKIADRNGKSKWISNAHSRQFVHAQLRSNTDAILTSYKTVLQDEASFTIRTDGAPIKETNVVIIDKALALLKKEYEKLPIFYERTSSKIYFITDKKDTPSDSNSIEYIQGVFNEDGIVFNSIVGQLLDKGLYSILIEGGRKLNSSLIDQNMADELYCFIASKILNDQQAISMFGIDKLNPLENASTLELVNMQRLQDDILLHYYIK
jgi:diaminohydroxyphosphoribosylaminopyrimidine deaminase/5-amino-6-(5-phosphoribosylamino)uracil reductase